jgi:hypothetical protein
MQICTSQNCYRLTAHGHNTTTRLCHQRPLPTARTIRERFYSFAKMDTTEAPRNSNGEKVFVAKNRQPFTPFLKDMLSRTTRTRRKPDRVVRNDKPRTRTKCDDVCAMFFSMIFGIRPLPRQLSAPAVWLLRMAFSAAMLHWAYLTALSDAMLVIPKLSACAHMPCSSFLRSMFCSASTRESASNCVHVSSSTVQLVTSLFSLMV